MQTLAIILFLLWLMLGPGGFIAAFVDWGGRRERKADAKPLLLFAGAVTVLGAPFVYWFLYRSVW